MAFWGVEVRPGKPYTHFYDPGRGRLRLCQATLGIGVAIKKSLVQCNVGRKSPVFLCALLPDKTESCNLDLEFEESEEVIFSVIGPRSVHLTGYYSAHGHKGILNDDSESYGEDIADTDSHESANSSADKYDDSFIDDNELEVSPFPVPGEDEGTKNEKKPKRRLKKKYQTIDSDEDVSSKQEKFDTECKIGNSATQIEDENEDEDNLVISILQKMKLSKWEKKIEMNTNTTNDILLKEKEGNVTPSMEDTNGLQPMLEKNEDTVTGINSLHPTVGKDEHTVTGIDGKSDRRKKSSKNKDTVTGVNSLHPMVGKDEHTVTGTDGKSDRRKKSSKNGETVTGINSLHPMVGKDEHTVTGTDGESDRRKNSSKNEDTTVTGIKSLHPTVGKDEHTVTGTDGESDRRKKSSKKRKRQLDTEEEMTNNGDNKDDEALQHELPDQKSLDDKPIETNTNPKSENDKEAVKPKKRKKKSETKENNVEDDLSKPRTISIGLIVEELQKGKHDGKIATTGKKVKVFLMAKLRDTGRIFYSNIDKSPLRFVIGSVDVVDGLHIGMDGMHVGDKRRLTIPPSMGYGCLGGGENIPPNSWLVYEVELLGVR